MKKLASPLINYDVVSTIEKIGTFPIHVLSLRDVDRALDEICKLYEPNSPEEEERLLDLCPYFGIVWPSARALATFMSERKKLFTKKRGIEVGAGLALPSLLAATLGTQMTVTDFHPDVGDWVKKNAALNEVSLKYIEWDWTNESPPSEITYGTYDFVLASDVLYEKRHPEELVRALAKLVTPTGSIYLSDPGRAYLERALTEFEKLGFHRVDFEFKVEESSPRAEVRLEQSRNVFVYEFIKE